MSEPRPQSLSPHFSNLIGQKVVFEKLLTNAVTGEKKIYALYATVPSENPVVVMADLSVLGFLAGALVGLPEPEIRSRITAPELDDVLKDAINEIFNVATPVISTQERAVLKTISENKSELGDAAEQILSKPHREVSFNVTINNYKAGRFHILS